MNHLHQSRCSNSVSMMSRYHHPNLLDQHNNEPPLAPPQPPQLQPAYQPSQSISIDEVTSRVLAMIEVEQNSYAYKHFLAKSPSKDDVDYRLNISWREKICQWSYNVVDHFDLSREIVAVSLHLFDRYLATRGNLCTGKMALLVSLTTLHISIKLYDPKKVEMSTLADLSRGQFTMRHIEEMEWKILFGLGWRLHPPTEYSYVSHYVLYLPQGTCPAARKEIFELARYLTELAVCDSYFVDVDKYTIAYAAILNVLEEMSLAQFSFQQRETFLQELAWNLGLHSHLPAVSAARSRLRAMFVATGSSSLATTCGTGSDPGANVFSSGRVAADEETGSPAPEVRNHSHVEQVSTPPEYSAPNVTMTKSQVGVFPEAVHYYQAPLVQAANGAPKSALLALLAQQQQRHVVSKTHFSKIYGEGDMVSVSPTSRTSSLTLTETSCSSSIFSSCLTSHSGSSPGSLSTNSSAGSRSLELLHHLQQHQHFNGSNSFFCKNNTVCGVATCRNSCCTASDRVDKRCRSGSLDNTSENSCSSRKVPQKLGHFSKKGGGGGTAFGTARRIHRSSSPVTTTTTKTRSRAMHSCSPMVAGIQ